ncbi:HmuY family protein [Sorangium sp. So ce726]|uniref:HmuY family protein n=1 Tax=Sorangium sp. So ce726 TaxID=3133319 RepID=UPI003F60E4D0
MSVSLVSSLLIGCSDSAGDPSSGPSGGQGPEGDPFASGTALEIPVPASGRVFVKLGTPAIAEPAGDPKASLDWDLAFEGFDVFTNSGPSGGGSAGVIGPFDVATFASDEAPAVPFLSADKAGGAFLDWYAYDDATHTLFSRYHVYGIQDGERLWKVQIMSYYGERDGATVGGLYQIRVAEITGDSAGEVTEIAGIDGTAGGREAPPGEPSECVDLGTGEKTTLSAEEASASEAWHLCFRRDAISVNGGLGGPRGVGAVDLDVARTAEETTEEVSAKTAEGELPRFQGVSAEAFSEQEFLGDRVVSGFGGAWLDRTKSPVAPASAAWLAADAGGQARYFLGFSELKGATATSPGTVVLHVKAVAE